MPGEFIALAEAIGLIPALGERILNQACRQATAWPEDLKLAVNLSPLQIRLGEAIVRSVATALAESGLAPHRLELEITESVLLSNTVETLATLHRLRGLGLRIAMDDFGTGHSSLSYLRQFPFDKVKIDRSFVRDLGTHRDSDMIVHAVVDLCKLLGMATTAEGVETLAQMERVVAIGCSEAQGYLFSRPVPGGKIAGLIAAQPPVEAPTDTVWSSGPWPCPKPGAERMAAVT
jgi:EAL domain-containing protein (putative c-di-GMP-specific phosphodiesterase class I)